MNKQIKIKWIKALFSGRYKQGRKKLRNLNNTFCCLGVLCDLYAKEKKIKWIKKKDDYFILKEDAILPERVKHWAGIESDVCDYDNSCLSADNDNGQKFKTIAKTIEEKF